MEGNICMNEETMLIAFKMISDAGDASSKFQMAVEEAEKYNFDKAEELLVSGKEALVIAHQSQTNLLHEEVNGNSVEYSLVMVHAQDHLMNAILLENMAKSILKLNRKLFELEKKDERN